MKLVLFGSTGMVGRAALLAAQNNSQIKEIVAVVRKDDLPPHPKLKMIVHQNLFDLSAIKSELQGATGSIFAIGVTSAGMSEEQYTKQTYEMTLAVARAMLSCSPGSRFVYVSGAGADSTEKGPVMWARVRGRTENELLALPFSGAYALRPAIIIPQDGIQSKTTSYRLGYLLMTPLLPLLGKLFPAQVTNTRKLGNLLVSLAVSGNEKKILESKDFTKF